MGYAPLRLGLTVEATEDRDVTDKAILVVATKNPFRSVLSLPNETVVFFVIRRCPDGDKPIANVDSALLQSDRPWLVSSSSIAWGLCCPNKIV